MTQSLVVGAFLAALFYVLIPGPAFLALLGIGAGQGRKAGAFFVSGHLLGDLVWSTLALVAIVGAKTIGTFVFDLLGLLCGFYLAWIGWSAVTAKPKGDGKALVNVDRPFRRGLIFGVTNPKGYPVALATFTALVAGSAGALTFSALPLLLTVSFAGFITADIILISIIGAGAVRRFYRAHERLIVRCSGVLFMGFAAQALWHATPGLLGWRKA
ncbi:threonine/homoserine/homoserine lactone efflux protein [Rhizobium sp. ERR 922]|uniref:Lysine transporter LysE n=1 Tax=Rhizobium dioscoreae TaxID=2653122 RepID=A0ABQ0ZCM9_9HYPH|nr:MULTISPECIES: LysE family translocator [Rhizobium]MCZ3375944.1 LysE family translocator [Rhizobium sp. AG207R]MDK4705853.1 LysE family translocator [Rhizobium sp. CNPSo 4062]TWB51968.1 threonine/homoserine/homoserine lactone efflux protein [Rhizobium sp. ERR 922]TWB94390.1 threonine/homoserine/homoserine lactone efflux protein [Rhizobium sp. ERR 942]GES53275.1 lysine transporter LysE [Rhizobium dioscoreae]